MQTRTADLYRVNFLGDLGTDEVERRQVAWGELISARFRTLLDPFRARPLSCLELFSGGIPVGPVAQVASARP